MIIAVMANKIDMVKLLIEKGAGMNVKDKEDDLTALMMATITNKIDMAKLLIKKRGRCECKR